ncbi:MAG: zinc-dependent peptidase [Lautropia sp.]
MALLILCLLGLAFIGWLIWQPRRQRARRARLRAQPFPAEWHALLQRRLPLYRRLPPALRAQLQQQMLVFVAEKSFIGCEGLAVTDEMRVLIAAQACLLILNRPTGVYPSLAQVLIYPEAFIVDKEEVDEDGVSHRERQVLTGESWAESQVVLSWPDVLHGAGFDDGENVVIHEFAHQLDQETGYANGAPELTGAEHYASWSEVLGEEFERLRDRIDAGEQTLLDDYGATDPVEFFAVVSEAFFEQPIELTAEHPALYRELSRFYRVDPAAWDHAA